MFWIVYLGARSHSLFDNSVEFTFTCWSTLMFDVWCFEQKLDFFVFELAIKWLFAIDNANAKLWSSDFVMMIKMTTKSFTRSYHTLVVDVYATCYIYRSRTEIFISCVCPTCSISLAERFYRTRSKIFISWVGGRPVVYHEWSAANTSDLQQVNPLLSL